MKYDFTILGADGMQGLIVSRYLLEKGYRIYLADQYRTKIDTVIKKFKGRQTFSFVDLRNVDETVRLITRAGAGIVINCADMYWNMNVYLACLETKTHCVDLGSWMELTGQQLRKDRAFKKIGRTAITGCGSVPGIGNVMLTHATRGMDSVTGIDVGFSWTSNMDKFVVPFSMKSILEEFAYNPKYLQDGAWVQAKPLSVVLERDFRAIGRQKTFLVQHPELFTFHHYFKNRGVRNVRFFAGFPEHSLHRIYSLIDMGFHSDKKVTLEGIQVAPFDMLLPVLKRISTPEGYTETENLWIHVKGTEHGKEREILMECIVPPLPGWEDAGCNIDTGFPASIIAEMIRDGCISESGSFAPEAIVPPESFFKELTAHGMSFYFNGSKLET